LLLVIVSAAFGGNNSSTSTATPTAAATAQATKSVAKATATSQASSQNGQDPFIVSMINAFNKGNPGQAQLISWNPASAVAGRVGSVMVGNNNDMLVSIDHFNSVARATEVYNAGVANQTAVAVRSEAPNAWGLSYYTAAAGHAPTTKHVQTNYVGGDFQQHQTVAQYDAVVVFYTHDDNPNGT
jgi:hypothetical protein